MRRGDARRYWTKLKNFLGLGKNGQQLPKELLVGNEEVQSQAARDAWRDAFFKLGQASESDTNFDDQFIKDCNEQIAKWLKVQEEAKRELDRPIEKEEVVNVVKSLKSGKACGIDGISGEILKHGGDELMEMTWKLCRDVFEAEQVPRDWSKGLIYPLYKGGDRRMTDNYRGIYLLSIVGKVYAAVLNQRLLHWCERSRIFGEEQGGFRPNRSTADHVFVLSEIVKERKTRGLERHMTLCLTSVCGSGCWT